MNYIKKMAGRIYKILYTDYFKFTNSSSYWESRYKLGKNSGDGSYGRLALFKAEVLNKFIVEESIETVIEFGCGDGNQLKLVNYKNYIGFDISSFIIKKCNKEFSNDKSKRFRLMKDFNDENADLTLSLDVIFHLIEDHIFHEYMLNLFNSSNRYVIIYSSNFESKQMEDSPHVKHRNFSKWIDANFPNFHLVNVIKNRYDFYSEAGTSLSDFYIFKKSNLV